MLCSVFQCLSGESPPFLASFPLFNYLSNMRKTIIILTVLIPLLASAQPDSYEPIFQITGENSLSTIGFLICNCGDQDGDGSDELLLSNHDPSSEVLMFYSGTFIDTLPDLTFSESSNTLGDLTYGESIKSHAYGSILIGYNLSNYSIIYLYNTGDSLDNSYDMSFQGESSGDGFGNRLSVGDINGDGWNDIVTSANQYGSISENRGKLYIYFGGSDMDNIVDFTITAEYNNFGDGLGSGLACGDVNGDGFDDILTMTSSPRTALLFYGGAELDSIPDWIYQAESPVYLTTLCTVVPDLTGDEYADIILEPSNIFDTYVFFGGEEVGSIPDQSINLLVGVFSNVGDLNGDGYGDVLGYNWAASRICPSYGSPSGLILGDIIQTPGEPTAVGRCGDINGDGFDDIAYHSWEPFYYGQAFVYADTTLTSVNRPPSTINRIFTLHPNYPNPFNAKTTIPFTLSQAGEVELKVFDVTGREVGAFSQTPLQGWYPAGNHSVVWNADGLASGAYLIQLTVDGLTDKNVCATRKVVLLK